MPTLVSNPANFGSIRNAFTTEGLGSSTSFFAYRQGGGIVPATSQYNVVGAGTVGDPLRMSQFNGLSVGPSVTFTPVGGASAGFPAYLEDVASTDASVSISCTENATWTYSGVGAGSSVSIGSGGSNFIITFYLTTTFNPRNVTFIVSATAGGVTQYWEVYLEVQGFA